MKRSYTIKNTSGNVTISTPLRGYDVLYQPMLNKGSAFPKNERKMFGLDGLLPPVESNIEDQCQRMYTSICKKEKPLAKYMSLISLHHRNEVLFYKLLQTHLEEFMPIIYTPTVGRACEEFSHIFRRTKGMWITPDDKGKIKEVLRNSPCDDARLIVITDNESILGIGDQGAGGIAISVGKLSLYCVGAGIHPSHLLPISLDVGTNNEKLLHDPLYIGHKKPRLTGKAYDELVDEFVEAVKEIYPKALIQWEDFRKQNAYNILDRHKYNVLSFNDDIQGTAGVALGGILTACEIKKEKLEDQRILILGAGAAGIGISRLLLKSITRLQPDQDALAQIAVTGSKGLLTERTDVGDPYKKTFLWSNELLEKYDIQDRSDLLHLIQQFKPTVLIGTSGQPGLFTKEMVQAMQTYCERPVVMPFSNPNTLSEAIPSDVISWTDGKALIATGSPFQPFEYNGKTYTTSQGNNVFIFPGVGLGALVAGAKTVKSEMFYLASKTLSQQVSADERERGMLFPDIKRLREITRAIAVAIVEEFTDKSSKEASSMVDDFMWEPNYPTLEADG